MPCRLLFEYAGALEGAFLPHAPAAASALIPAVTFRFNEEVRSAAALALAKVSLPRAATGCGIRVRLEQIGHMSTTYTRGGLRY